MYCPIVLLQEAVDAPEDLVNLFVSASTCPPSLNDANVVVVDLDMGSGCGDLYDVSDQKFETDCLCPSDVSSLAFPTWDKLPCSPILSNRNSDAPTRAGVRVCTDVDEGPRLWYWS